jgi:hypothetical membrane protein
VPPLKVLGITAGTVPWLFILISIALSPWFNVYDNALSDLGNIARNHPVAYIFDGGLFVSGLLAVAFGLVLSSRRSSWKMLVWSIPLTLASIDLSLIGVFSEDAGSIHGVVSVIFFVMTIVTMLCFSYVSWPLSAPRLGGISLVLGFASALIWVAPWPWGGVAIQEASTAAFMTVLLVLLARKFA